MPQKLGSRIRGHERGMLRGAYGPPVDPLGSPPTTGGEPRIDPGRDTAMALTRRALATGILYLAVGYPAALFVRWLERRTSRAYPPKRAT